MDIKIIYEDSDLLVIDKPSGITVNRSDTTKEEETVQDWAQSKLKIKNEKLKITNNQSRITNNDQNSEFVSRGGVVHRLDRETSGLLIIAKNPASFLNLQNQFKERKVKKVYLALVHGLVKPETGEINVPVGRLSFNRKRFGIVAGGRDSVTSYRVITNYQLPITNEALTLLELYPKTGRTHQIRVHLKYFGHPVFSDPLYGGRKVSRADRKLLPRLFLHAGEISFQHPSFAKASAGGPKTNKVISLESPLPQELVNFLSTLSEVSI